MEEIQIPIVDFAPEISPISDLGLFVSRVAGAALLVAGLAFLLYFIWGGIGWVMAGNDSNKVEEAKQRITNALIGLLVTAAAWAIFLLVNHFLGLGIAGGTSSLGAGTGSGGQCGGGLAIGETGALNGVTYQCVAGGTPCGSGNPNGYSYPFNCPVQCVNNTSVSCR